MRRRQAFAEQAAAAVAQRVHWVAIDDPVVFDPVQPPSIVTLEGHCPKCGKRLGRRGAHFHIRACKG